MNEKEWVKSSKVTTKTNTFKEKKVDFYIQGLTLGLAYVAPIGMQNLFVINSALTQPRWRAAW